MARRRLDPDERELWSKVTKDVTPLTGASPVSRVPILREGQGNDLLRHPANAKSILKKSASSTIVPVSTTLQPVSSAGDPRQARHIRRGRREIDATLDLHGLTQDQAFSALQQFLLVAQARQHRILLVITGKGARETIYAPFSMVSRGVLRHRFIEWADGPFRDYISGISPAHQRHGGSGAFYVMLKKQNPR